MRRIRRKVLFLTLAGCASIPQPEFIDQAVLKGFTGEQVRDAARIVLEEVAHPRSIVRVREDQVVTDGRIGRCERDFACGEGTLYGEIGTPWTTIEVHLTSLGQNTAVEVEIEYESFSHCGSGYRDATCHPQFLSSTGALEHRIIEEIRARLESENDTLLGE